MKVSKEQALFRVPCGSRLYGTDTPESDYDYKVICLPALDDLLLNKKVTNRKVKPVGTKAGDKMQPGEEETEYVPLQVFLDDVFNGQTYALEAAFAVKQRLHTSTRFLDENPFDPDEQASFDYCVEIVNELIDNFLTRNVKKMVGYAVSQAKVYGLKTERYATIVAAIDLISEEIKRIFKEVKRVELKTTLGDSPELRSALLALPHVRASQVLNADGGTELSHAIEISGKQFLHTASLSTIFQSLLKIRAGYGERVASFEGLGVDWKALSHAIRITEQVIELCETGRVTFPRPNAKVLRKVKAGEVSLQEATAHLEKYFSQIDGAVEASVLPEKTPELDADFEDFKLRVLKELYRIN